MEQADRPAKKHLVQVMWGSHKSKVVDRVYNF
jgi:hypothetical protein